MKTLFYGYGNPGRSDDGLGVRFVEELERYIRAHKIPDISFDSNYQLNIEDADTIREYDLVFFCDASQEDIDGFCITPVKPSDARVEFTMHAVSPAFVLDLCRKIYGRTPDTRLLHLKGYVWDFKEGLSEDAEKNLQAALTAFYEMLPSLAGNKMPEIIKSSACT